MNRITTFLNRITPTADQFVLEHTTEDGHWFRFIYSSRRELTGIVGTYMEIGLLTLREANKIYRAAASIEWKLKNGV